MSYEISLKVFKKSCYCKLKLIGLIKMKKVSLVSLCIHYLSHRKSLFVCAVVCGGIYGVMSGLGLPLIFEKVFKNIFEKPEDYNVSTILFIAAMVPLGFFVRGLFGYLSTFWMNRCGLEVLTELRSDIFRKLQYLPLSFFEKKASGDLIHRVVSDPKSVQDLLLEMASEAIKQPLQMVMAFLGLIYFSVKYCDAALLGIFLIAIPLCFLPVHLLRSRVKNNSRLMQQAEAEVTACVSENLQAAQEIRNFCMEERALVRIKTIMQKLSQRIELVVIWQKMQQPLMEVVSAGIISVIFVYAYWKKIPFSIFSAMGTALYFAFDPIKKITNLIGSMQRTTGALERIADILNQPLSIQSPQSGFKTNVCDGCFQLENVCFRYASSEENVLNAINFEIPSKQFCALVGPSGAGKSTFIKLLPRLYDISSGSIRCNGVELREWDLEALRKQIAIVSQSTILFNDTILNNLRIGKPEASDVEIIKSAKLAYAHDFIMEAGGYDVIIGENGNRFSGGQRQRLAIARAFLKNAPILVLDEATSALDSESEFCIKKAIEKIAENKTVIAIAHRISTIQNADCIFVFDQGNLVGQGTHNRLLAENNLYQQLVAKQLLNT